MLLEECLLDKRGGKMFGFRRKKKDETAGLGGTIELPKDIGGGLGPENAEPRNADYGGGFGLTHAPVEKPERPFGFEQQPIQQLQQGRGDVMSKELEVISSKLDALRAMIDNINQRLSNIERSLEKEKYKW